MFKMTLQISQIQIPHRFTEIQKDVLTFAKITTEQNQFAMKPMKNVLQSLFRIVSRIVKIKLENIMSQGTKLSVIIMIMLYN